MNTRGHQFEVSPESTPADTRLAVLAAGEVALRIAGAATTATRVVMPSEAIKD